MKTAALARRLSIAIPISNIEFPGVSRIAEVFDLVTWSM
jgi:hypothetical protein